MLVGTEIGRRAVNPIASDDTFDRGRVDRRGVVENDVHG